MFHWNYLNWKKNQVDDENMNLLMIRTNLIYPILIVTMKNLRTIFEIKEESLMKMEDWEKFSLISEKMIFVVMTVESFRLWSISWFDQSDVDLV